MLLLATRVFASGYPKYTNYVNDFANVLKKETVSRLNTKLKSYEDQTTNQIAVATIQTTQPELIEEYAVHMFDQWKPGQKNKDNGVLMVYAMQDHHMRIEVGRGLEGELTDIESKHILDDVVKPEFKAGNYDDGVSKGIDAVIVAISTESGTLTASTKTNTSAGGLIVVLIFLGIIIIAVVAVSPFTPIGGQGTWGMTDIYSSSGGSFFSSGIGSAIGSAIEDIGDSVTSSDDDGGGFGGFGGGTSSGGGASSSW